MNRSLRNVPLNWLKAFESAARNVSIKDAAAELAVTSSAVSQQVHRLEEHLATRLFTSKGGRLLLTDEGARLSASLGSSFRQIDVALNNFGNQDAKQTIVIASSPPFFQHWLIPRLSTFSAAYPDVNVELSTVRNFSEIDLSVTDVGMYVGNPPGVRMRQKVFDDILVPVCAPSMAAKIAAPADVLKLPLLHAGEQQHWKLWLSAQSIEERPSRGMAFTSGALAIDAAVAGVGVAICQQSYILRQLKAGVLVAPLASYRSGRAYYLCSNVEAGRSPVISAFMEWARQQILQSESDV